ncbi:hypothetical protein DNTS_025505 [Danionella cerebrum]|uniref:Uncharacterized protein n=1 Tax=Danionella cerebrum TaxID=2873325 RepID=A0A553R9A2_9TELE|nr:hypothetical protein DNTS_025505 [Danionella translucida]
MLSLLLAYVKLTDFQKEVRIHQGLDSLLTHPGTLLEENMAMLDGVLCRKLEHLAWDRQDNRNAEEVTSALFTDAGGQDINGAMRPSTSLPKVIQYSRQKSRAVPQSFCLMEDSIRGICDNYDLYFCWFTPELATGTACSSYWEKLFDQFRVRLFMKLFE